MLVATRKRFGEVRPEFSEDQKFRPRSDPSISPGVRESSRTTTQHPYHPIIMNFPGAGGSFGGMGAAGMSEQQLQEQKMIRTMQAVMESCPGKTVMSGVMGFALGGAFGLFMSSVCHVMSFAAWPKTPLLLPNVTYML